MLYIAVAYGGVVDNKIADGGAVALAEAVTSCTQLQTLDLSGECHPVLQPVGCSVGS